MLLGGEAVERLCKSSVIIFGVGGVGGHALEAIARAGVGRICVVDGDTVSVSNLNRQLLATVSTVGRPKAEVARERVLEINPEAKVTARAEFYSPENADSFPLSEYDLVLDCIDSVKSKLHLIESAKRAGVPVISALGAGNKLDPTRFRITDISKTHTDPLAKVIRTELRKRGINHLTVVFSDEEPKTSSGERLPGSVSFVPGAAGLVMAAEAVRLLSEVK